MRLLVVFVFSTACAAHRPIGSETSDSRSFESIQSAGLAPVEHAEHVQSQAVVLHNATVWTATGQRHEIGWVHFEEGQILGVGAGDPPDVPGAQRFDLAGAWVTPGLIDTHSHLGVYPSPWARAHGDGNEASSPSTPGVWAEHSFWPQDPGIQRAVAGGVTAMMVLPGSANIVGGRGVILELLPALGSRAMRFEGAPETVKMACGENPKRVYGDRGGPSTRMGNLRAHRTAFLQAQQRLEAWEDFEEEVQRNPEADPPDRDLDDETLIGILRGDFLPHVHCYRADDMLSILQLADEFGFSIRSFHHALESYKIRDVLAEKNVSSSTWADWWGFKLEAYDGIPHNAALLTESGAIAVIHSDSAEGIQRLNQEAAKAYYWGLQAGIDVTEDDALAWITTNAAWSLGIEDLTGSIEVGKRADIAVWDNHPFSVYTKAHKVWVRGVLAHDADSDEPPWSDFLLGQEVSP